jgi:glycosyltransferase involved in cell wall biosynthesis
VGPLVSILINNYNYARYVSTAIESALAQSYPHCEVIVVDDGSTDDSKAVIAAFGDRIKPIFKTNGGQASAFNTGFRSCRGEVVCLLDSDDIFLSDKVKNVVTTLGDQRRGWHFHRLQWTDAVLQSIEMPPCEYDTGDYDLRLASRTGAVLLSPPSTSGLSFTRRLLEQIMPMPESITITSDNYIKYAALALAAGYCDRRKLALQRIHGCNAYTLKKDDGLKADVLLKTAVGLRTNLPFLRTACNQMFAEALAVRLRSGAGIPELCRDARSYLGYTSLTEKVALVSRFTAKVAGRGFSSILSLF